jgi:hypothetical protein
MKEVNQYLTGNALTGKKLKSVKAIVIHWFADPMAKATNVIKWWQSQANGVSAHDVICLDGTVYHAVPYDAMAYQVGCPRGYTQAAVNRLSSYPNDCVVGIECAHLDDKGTMTPETYNSLVQLSAKLLQQFNLTINDLWLHSEIVGKDYKDCHRWFTTTKPEDWPKFKNDVAAVLNPAKNGWVKDGNTWFFYKDNVKQKGWIKDKDKWYYLSDTGAMFASQWLKYKEKWYYLQSSGAMATGLIEVNGKHYYLNPDGSMLTNGRVNVSLNVSADGSLHP